MEDALAVYTLRSKDGAEPILLMHVPCSAKTAASPGSPLPTDDWFDQAPLAPPLS